MHPPHFNADSESTELSNVRQQDNSKRLNVFFACFAMLGEVLEFQADEKNRSIWSCGPFTTCSLLGWTTEEQHSEFSAYAVLRWIDSSGLTYHPRNCTANVLLPSVSEEVMFGHSCKEVRWQLVVWHMLDQSWPPNTKQMAKYRLGESINRAYCEGSSFRICHQFHLMKPWKGPNAGQDRIVFLTKSGYDCLCVCRQNSSTPVSTNANRIWSLLIQSRVLLFQNCK